MVEKVAAGNFMQLQQPDWSCALQCATGFRWAAILSFPIFLPSNSFFHCHWNDYRSPRPMLFNNPSSKWFTNPNEQHRLSLTIRINVEKWLAKLFACEEKWQIWDMVLSKQKLFLPNSTIEEKTFPCLQLINTPLHKDAFPSLQLDKYLKSSSTEKVPFPPNFLY